MAKQNSHASAAACTGGQTTRGTRSGWQRFKLVLKVVEVRLRFIAILVATALVIGYWDTIKNYWDKWTRPAASVAREVDPDHEFYCPMHPQVVRAGLEPNGEVPKCPICGMPLSLRNKGEVLPLPPGVTGRVQLSPERIQLAGVQTAEISYRPLSKQIETVGNVTYDESRLSRVVSRVSGYVEKLYVDKTFVTVAKGEPLAEIYSPDLYSTAQELLLATKSGARSDLAGSTRQRLKLLDVSQEEIDQIIRSGVASPRLVIRSPQAGYVIGKEIVAGARVDAGMTLLEVADLSVVWIEADVYEKDIALIRAGQKAEAVVEAIPHRVFVGKVSLVYPRLDTATRTDRVRFEVENLQHELRPGMYATVRINIPLDEMEPFRDLAKQGELLAVPERAVIDTGSKQIVYVQRDPGLFEGVEVELGPRIGGWYPVIKGLQAGDRVAAAGAFLIDAETRLNPAAASTYYGASGGPQAAGSRGAKPAALAPGAPRQEQSSRNPDRRQQEVSPRTRPALSADALKNIAQLPAEDQRLALAQGTCPVTGAALGSMGVPHKITIGGQAVFLCCKGCVAEASRNPQQVLQKAAELRSAGGSQNAGP